MGTILEDTRFISTKKGHMAVVYSRSRNENCPSRRVKNIQGDQSVGH
jgi:hypothetical protein